MKFLLNCTLKYWTNLLSSGGRRRRSSRGGNKSAHKAETKRRAARRRGSQWANGQNGIEINGQVMASGQKGNGAKMGTFRQIAKFYLEMKCVLLGAPAGHHQCATICGASAPSTAPSRSTFRNIILHLFAQLFDVFVFLRCLLASERERERNELAKRPKQKYAKLQYCSEISTKRRKVNKTFCEPKHKVT